jgi:hypothetical protein
MLKPFNEIIKENFPNLGENGCLWTYMYRRITGPQIDITREDLHSSMFVVKLSKEQNKPRILKPARE